MSAAKEPLAISGEISGDVEGYGITCQPAQPHHATPLYAIAFSEEDARRIVACVSALQNRSTEELEKAAKFVVYDIATADLCFCEDLEK